MKQGRLGATAAMTDMVYYHQIYGLIQAFTAEKVWKFWFDDKWVRTRMEMNPAREWYLWETTALWRF